MFLSRWYPEWPDVRGECQGYPLVAETLNTWGMGIFYPTYQTWMIWTNLCMWERGGRLVWVWPPASVLNWSSLSSKLSKNVSRFSFWRIVSSFRPWWICGSKDTGWFVVTAASVLQWLMRTEVCSSVTFTESQHLWASPVTSQLFRCHHHSGKWCRKSESN